LKYLLFLLLVLTAFLQCKVSSDNQLKTLSYSELHHPKKLGVCWVAGDSIANHNFSQLTSVNGNWISQTPFAYQPDIDKPELRFNPERAWWGEADRGLIHTAKLAKENQIKTMLKPHIWLRVSDGRWRSDLAMTSAEDWDTWFDNYRTMILHYTALAQAHNMEALCIGTELHQTTKHHPDKWRALIAEIRDIYDGELTYAANWYKEYEDITFWDALDYIGIQAYFPLSNEEFPDKSELLKNWNSHKRAMKKISDKYGKQIVFTEIGYKNTADSAKEPWTWPQKLELEKAKQSDETQLLLYEAMFESLYHEEWVDGFFIWKWFHTTYKYDDYEEYFAIREARYDSLRKARNWGERPSVHFTPQKTAAISILKDWYGKADGK